MIVQALALIAEYQPSVLCVTCIVGTSRQTNLPICLQRYSPPSACAAEYVCVIVDGINETNFERVPIQEPQCIN